MNGEVFFRMFAGVLFFSALAISIYFRSGAERASGEQLDRSEEGKALRITLRLGGLLLWLTLIAYLINPVWMGWASYASPVWLRWLGMLTAGTGLALTFWMFRSLGKNITDTVVTRREHQLVTHGPYRWIRHPLYTFGTLFYLGLGLIAASWLIMLMACLAFFLLSLRTPKEEAQLLARFGDEYADYTESTGRYLPKLSTLLRRSADSPA
ncbi:MAG TPA: isoprenylcysteine carboxylmethyltransferase family protein [Anaerolineales bacterium]|nr:isoprenylcysteine carboxylmethyltransferase family protein [Anaerolineales bacterium]